MGHPLPLTDEERNEIPRLRWPLIWIFTAGYIVLASLIDFTVDIDSAADASGARSVFPFAVIGLILAIRFLLKRLKERQQWRDERFIDWLKTPWPAPPETDWEAFERELVHRSAHPGDL